MSEAYKLNEYDENRRYTYADYLTWKGSERCQLINGEIFMTASRRYISSVYKENAVVPAAVLPGLEIAFKELWELAENLPV